MDIKKLHEPFKDDDSPAAEGQVVWLQKQGFNQAQIDRAMVDVYSALDRGERPQLWYKKVPRPGGDTFEVQKIYLHQEEPTPGPGFESKDITTGWDLDQFLLQRAKFFKKEDMSAVVKNIETFEANMRKKWEARQRKKRWWRRRR